MEYIPFIDENKLHKLLEDTKEAPIEQIEAVFAKALEMKGLELEDVAMLLNIKDKDTLDKLYHTALQIKEDIYGNRLVLFAPLYISNFCSNNCLYCGFRVENTDLHRHTLTIEQIKEETKLILDQGHKRVLMLMGENHKNCSLDYFIEAIEAVYSVRDEKGNNIRRINVEIAPLTDDEFQKLNKVQIGTYTVFQETYHKETYQKMHLSGKKSDYEWRLFVMDRALQNGMGDVGIGALFGLYDYKFEVLGLIEHAKHLDNEFGVGPHTISIPRIQPADHAPASHDTNYIVSDEDFKKLVAVIRLAVPYTGMILSTRESVKMRTELFNMGISQISAGSKTNIGGYKQALDGEGEIGQFELNDCRSSGEVIKDVIKMGFVPSFCTGCYRLGRVGADFMDLAKPGLIKLHCLPNALTTLKEYLEDYADEETKIMGEELIQKELNNIPNESRREKTVQFLEKIHNGERDLYF